MVLGTALFIKPDDGGFGGALTEVSVGTARALSTDLENAGLIIEWRGYCGGPVIQFRDGQQLEDE